MILPVTLCKLRFPPLVLTSGVAGKIANFDLSTRRFGVQSARSISYDNLAAARFDLNRTATILDLDRATACVRPECSL